SSRRRHTRSKRDWSSDVCSSDLGLLNSSGQVGGALGLAVLAALSAARSGALTGAGATPASALAGGFHIAWLAAAAIVGIALLVRSEERRVGKGGRCGGGTEQRET